MSDNVSIDYDKLNIFNYKLDKTKSKPLSSFIDYKDNIKYNLKLQNYYNKYINKVLKNINKYKYYENNPKELFYLKIYKTI